MTDQIHLLPIDKIRPNPHQPRTVFDKDELQQLADSIRETGLQSPVLVEIAADGYVLVAGERRLRAHKMIGAESIRAIVREHTNHEGRSLLIDAMTENVQRHNMNPVDEAHGYQKMHVEFKMSVRAISKKVGIYEARISNLLKLAELETPIKELIKDGRLPGSVEAVKALSSVPAGSVRVEFAKTLAARSATIKMMISASARLVSVLNDKQSHKVKGAPALNVGRRLAGIPRNKTALPNWNALKQVGKLPPWELLVSNIEATCDACSLRDMASDATCGDCPLVDMVRRLMEKTNVSDQ